MIFLSVLFIPKEHRTEHLKFIFEELDKNV